MKAIIIKDLKKLEEFLVEPLILIPKPKIIHRFERNNAFILASDCSICFLKTENEQFLLEELNEALEQFSIIKLKKVDIKDTDKQLIDNKSKWDLLDVNDEEGYNLEIFGNRITIYSLYEKGLFYGIQTLIQIIKNIYLSSPNLTGLSKRSIDKLILPEIEIKDVPDLKMRGITQDISRGQIFSIENAKRYIKILSHYKMNTYGIVYLGDVFIHPKYPDINKDRGALNAKEIREIDDYAKKRYINFIPIYQCLGHNDDLLMHEKYEHLGEFPGAQCLDISNPDVLPFLNDYITEISKVFSSEYFHIASDESFDFGNYNSESLIREKGRSQVLTEFYNNMHDMVTNAGKRYVIMYDDIVRNDKYLMEHLNKDIILMYWFYGKRRKDSKIKKLLDANHRVIVSPSMMNWQRNFPDNIISNKNIINLTKGAYKYRDHGCLGVLTSSWGDARFYSFRENEIFGAILTSAITWNVKKFNLTELRKNFGTLFYGINKESIGKFHDLFVKLSSSALNYYRIIKLLPPFFFTYFFKHPFHMQKYKPTFSKYKDLGKLAFQCLELYPEIEKYVIFEKENFEYMKYGAELAYYLQEKIDCSVRVSKLLMNPELTDDGIKSAIKDLNNIKEKIEYLKENYEKFWLRAAKRPFLDEILRLFDFLINCYNNKIKQIEEKTYFVDPYLPSEWIWVKETKCPTKPRYFRRIIEIPSEIKKAVIQAIGCTQMKITINDEYIGEVKSRMSLSILPIINRVKIFDVTNRLKKGKNIISIEAYSYERYKGAINLYGQIQLKNDMILEIITDNSWVSNKKEMFDTQDWVKLDFNDSTWKKVKSYGRPPNLNGDIFKPNLLKGEKSNTQDYFDINGYFNNVFDTVLRHSFLRIVKPLAARSIKFVKPFGD